MQIIVDTFNQKIDSAQHRQGWEGTVTDVLGVIRGMHIPAQACLWVMLSTHTWLTVWIFVKPESPVVPLQNFASQHVLGVFAALLGVIAALLGVMAGNLSNKVDMQHHRGISISKRSSLYRTRTTLQFEGTLIQTRIHALLCREFEQLAACQIEPPRGSEVHIRGRRVS